MNIKTDNCQTVQRKTKKAQKNIYTMKVFVSKYTVLLYLFSV